MARFSWRCRAQRLMARHSRREAVTKGASAIVISANASVDAAVPVLKVEEPRRFLSLAAARFFGVQPAVMTAVTGTAGKTSVASFTRQIWRMPALPRP